MSKILTIPVYALLSTFILFSSCKNKEVQTDVTTIENSIQYASGFALYKYDNYTKLVIKNPYPNAKKHFEYYLTKNAEKLKLPKDAKVITIPIKKIVVTSTTHIPMLDILNEVPSLVGFPNLKYISTPSARVLIDAKKVQELGNDMQINTEILLSLNPNLVVGFSMQSANKMYATIEKSGIPVILNGDWLEEKPLGRAEWLKFFGALYDKSSLADSLFNTIADDYNSAKQIALKAKERPSILSGTLFKGVWNLPAGDSFVAQFLEDANTNYYWKNTKGTGSLSLNFESVLDKAQNAEFWIAPGYSTSFKQLKNTYAHYSKFEAVKNKQVYTFALTKGATGGVIYYEEAPIKPHIVLKDIIKITHPHLLPNYKPYFLKKLN